MRKRLFLIITLLFYPIFVYAKYESSVVFAFYFWELFCTIHSSIFLLKPLSEVLTKDGNNKKTFWILFGIRTLILLVVTPFFPFIGIFDFMLMFIGPFISINSRKKIVPANISNNVISAPSIKIKCPDCGYEMASSNSRCPKCGKDLVVNMKLCPNCQSEQKDDAKFCSQCGADLTNVASGVEKKVVVDLYCENCKKVVKGVLGDKCSTCNSKLVVHQVLDSSTGTAFNIADYDFGLRTNNENMYIGKLVSEELKKNPSSFNNSLPDIEKRKTIMTLIYSVVTVLFILLYAAYHVNLAFMFFLFIILTIIYFIVISKYNLKSYIIKQVKERPDEKISYITSSIISSATTNRTIFIGLRVLILVILLLVPIYLFREPHLIYEKQDNDYVLRYYTLGFSKTDSELVIPDRYKDGKVVGIRGDVFKNVKNLKTVILPPTIEEIRGGAFENCSDLERINIPVKVTEIHGDTFSGCTSLEEIVIPDKVTRIGGHAFYGCHSLREVVISDLSELKEIGSSAFRECYNLYNITLPYGVDINERAFKESPTDIKYHSIENSSMIKDYQYRVSHKFIKDQDEEFKFDFNNTEVKVKLRYIYSSFENYSFDVEGLEYLSTFSLGKNTSYEKYRGNLLIVLSEHDSESAELTFYYN